MGFLSIGEEPVGKRPPKNRISDETLHRAQCTLCPLGKNGAHVPDWYVKLKHPHMAPWGTDRPLVYMLGEAPGEVEDRRGRPFVGPSGSILRRYLPGWANDKELRWNNVVRTRPFHNETPEREAIEACRPSVTKDIEQSKPFAVMGFGNVPLKWAIGEAGITTWTGRHFPIKIGEHVCWYFPILHPSGILRKSGNWEGTEDRDLEFGFGLDIERAFKILDHLPDPVIHTKEAALANIECIDGSKDGDVERVLAMLEHCADANIVGFDYETNRKRPYEDGAKLLSLGLSTKERTMALALEHRESSFKGKALDRVYDGIEDFLLDGECTKVVHALAFELEWTGFMFGKHTLRSGKWGDTMSQAYVLDERRGGHSLEFLCWQYFGINVKEITGSLNRKKMDSEPLTKMLPYQGVDARYHRFLYNVQDQELKADGTLGFYRKMLRRVPTMVLTQLKGIPIYQPRVRKLYDKWMDKRADAEDKIQGMRLAKMFKERHGEFRPSATGDVRKILELAGVKGVKSVDENELKKVKDPIAQAILDYREAHKILSTYVIPVLDIEQMKNLDAKERAELVEAEAGSALMPDGRMHPVTTTTKTRTSRSASEDTNYQNWPKRDNKEIRGQVAVLHPWKLASFDYGQIQARNVAMESLDKELIDAFWSRYDIHHDWTERIVKLYPKWMDEKGGYDAVKASIGAKENHWKWYRDRTKNLFVFPSFFGAQPPKLSTYLDIPQDYTERLAGMFWKKFPSIHAWQQGLIDDFYANGYTTSLAGHRRHAPASTNEIINAPIQADEAEIVCNAMARLSERGKDKFQANMEIHDDLTFIWRADEVEENALIVVEEMITVPYEWANVVPIVVEMSVGADDLSDWANKTDVGNYASDTWKRSLGIDDSMRHKLGIG